VALLRGFAPLLAWTAFSFLYYGFPLPNTVYAKLNTGVPAAELAQQGVHYLFNSLSLDPITLVVILAGIAVPLALRQPGAGPMVAGLGLHLVYVVRVGGDFMSGRFLAAPLLIAVVLLARSPAAWAPRPFALALSTLAAVGFLAPYPPLTTTAAFYASRGERFGLLDERGITDERAIYYRGTGLMTASRAEPMPAHYMARAGRKARAEGDGVVTRGAVGMFGFFAGPGIHIIDPNGLGDAFLARLPAGPGWRIGHFDRRLPPGYEASVRKGGLRIVDPQLAAYYRKLRLVTQGDLLDGERLRAIWGLNFGSGRHLVDDYFRIHSTRQRAALDRVSTPLPADADWTTGTVFSEHGLDVDLGGLRHAGGLELSVDGNDAYKVVCLRDEYPLWETTVPARPSPQGSFTAHRIAFPAAVAARGCDTIRILPQSGDQQYALGHLRLVDGAVAPAGAAAPADAVSPPDPTAEEPDAVETAKPKKEEPR
jgi:arabinofuranosyltransferase